MAVLKRHLRLVIMLAVTGPLAACSVDIGGHDEGYSRQAIGMPVYPGARPAAWAQPAAAHVNFTGSFSDVWVTPREFESDAAPVVVLDFYREAMRRHGYVIECRGTINVRRRRGAETLVCVDQPSSPAVQLAVDRDGRHQVVVVTPRGAAAQFAVLSVHTRR
jgi:hypothetical protein